jgi:nucleotide-binding universal stress UspA family protein
VSSRVWSWIDPLTKSVRQWATAVTATEAWSALELASQAERGAAHPIRDYEKNIAALAEGILSTVSATARSMGVACVTLHTKDRDPAEGIIQTAKARGCDLIVMASHGRRDLQKVLLGSQANKVLSYSSIPVLICRLETASFWMLIGASDPSSQKPLSQRCLASSGRFALSAGHNPR